MRLLIDTDVLIDVALDRRPFAETSSRLLDHAESHPGVAYIAWHSVANFYYMVASPKGRAAARGFISELLEFVAVAPVTTADLVYALSLEMRDLEDAMQAAAAVASGANCIVTRNVPHYRKSPVKALTPADWLRTQGAT